MANQLGVLAFGDSITNAGGELQNDVALQSWAMWTARGLGLPYTGCAVDGAVIDGVLGDQIPRWRATTADPAARYDVGCLYIGVNDVRRPAWDADAFAPGYDAALAFLDERCERRLVLTAPVALGRPRAGAKVLELNAIIRAAAADHGALVVSLEDFGARNHVMVDHVHPTAFGQVAIARRALHVLAADGMTVRADPVALMTPQTTRWGRVRGDWTYVYRDLKERRRVARVVRRARRSG